MNTFLAAYSAECCKLKARKKYIVFLCIGAAICVLWALLGNLIAAAIMNASGLYRINLTPSPMGTIGFFVNILLPFLIFMAATDAFTVEGAENTMKAMIMRPVERWKLFTAKILAIMTYVAIFLCVVFVFSAAFQMILGGFDGVIHLVWAFVSYIIVLIPLGVLCCFAVLVSLLFTGGTLSMFVLLLSYLALNVLPILFTGLTQLFFTDYLSLYKLFVGAVPVSGRLLNMILIVLGYGVVFFAGGSLLFDRKEY